MEDESGSNPPQEKDPHSSSASPLREESESVAEGPILLVEDSAGDIMLVRETLREHDLRREVVVVTDGEAAVRYIDGVESDESRGCPALVILDLNLPRIHGFEVLRHLRLSSRWRGIPVIVLSTADTMEDRRRAAELGANHYIRKSPNLDQFMAAGLVFKAALQGQL